MGIARVVGLISSKFGTHTNPYVDIYEDLRSKLFISDRLM